MQGRTLGSFQLRLPATSANLGPGFDAVAVALDFYLEIEAEAAAEFSIAADGPRPGALLEAGEQSHPGDL